MLDKAERLKKAKALPVKEADQHLEGRLPPGQFATERFPILHEGDVPEYDIEKWELRVFGEVEEAKTFSFAELMALPQTRINCDIHCVTRWSKFDTVWEGVLFRDFLSAAGIHYDKESIRYVMFHADSDYETNVPLDDLLQDNILLAHTYNGKPLTDKHGWPLRLVIPHLYFWKSAKWLTGIEFMKEDRPGFWERNGFHNYADPFREQRFSGEALPIPEDEWTKKEYD
ncbi:sulfite oxidase-like oxidoreductase [Paenibacillus eucommiae]|uniref:DMSO/TMAO reductase YedYZ molybdopterin-dependent catalytic subunit n=1 Tax=Paenibacillus eucommiae TaxID=1355755 RepID=A0ABS4IXE3_9BACL|nr:sulfite oxidase-like oxidoreductase [Paenibacillus eucommiae]MBP1992258.1 DMSO/TMAO reductase YedYZ molybdopterin-dependent catalytic subunit [Paenibacillus eucommiae]